MPQIATAAVNVKLNFTWGENAGTHAGFLGDKSCHVHMGLQEPFARRDQDGLDSSHLIVLAGFDDASRWAHRVGRPERARGSDHTPRRRAGAPRR